jgi:hypothetical protein
MSVLIKRGSSRLAHAELVVVDGIEFWTRPNIPDLPASETDRTHIVEDRERMDTIANDKYRRQDFWWVIAHRNDFRLLPNALVAGKKIVIPDASLIRRELF